MSTNSISFDYVLCSRRLKELRQEKHISHQALADTIGVSKQVVINYEVAANNGGVVTNSPSDKTLSVAGMKIETLYKLAEYYNVSTDYLLGRTDVKTADTQLKTICEVTNLSEAAAKKIIKLNEKENQSDIDYSDMLFNQMIESPEFDEIVNVLYTALCFRHLALPDKEVIEQVNKEIETNRNSPFWQYALATAKGGLSPYYKQQLSELICKFYDRINQEYLSEDEKYMQSKGENDNG